MITKDRALMVVGNHWLASPLSILETFQTIVSLYERVEELENKLRAVYQISDEARVYLGPEWGSE